MAKALLFITKEDGESDTDAVVRHVSMVIAKGQVEDGTVVFVCGQDVIDNFFDAMGKHITRVDGE